MTTNAKTPKAVRKRNVPGYIDESGRFRPIRNAEFVGSGASRRPAKRKDVKKYSRVKAGDLGKARQERALEDPWDREARLQRERAEHDRKLEAKILKEIEAEVFGHADENDKGRTLAQFVRSRGGIRRTFRFGGKADLSGRKSSWDAGEIDRLSLKGSGSTGLTTSRSDRGETLDTMFKLARQEGYNVADIDDMLERIETETAGGRATYATHGALSYNPRAKKNPDALTTFATLAGGIASALNISEVMERRNKRKATKRKTTKARKNPRPLLCDYKGCEVKAKYRIGKDDYCTKHAKALVKGREDVLEYYRMNPANDYPFVCLECGHKFRSARAAEKASAEGCPDCGGVDIDENEYYTPLVAKKNPVGWFRDVSPATADAVKTMYRKLAAKYHPDRGGDTRTMQEINADYDKAMKAVLSGKAASSYASQAEKEKAAARPIREAIEFAVTLPDDVDVVIRGLWLWLQGKTFAVRDKIKAFRTSDGKGFRWASKKKAWYFAGIPASNRRGEMSFADIEALHGRQRVEERRRRLALNPTKAAKAKAIDGDLYLLTISRGDDTLGFYVHDGNMDGVSKFKTLAAARKFAKGKGKKLVENPADEYDVREPWAIMGHVAGGNKWALEFIESAATLPDSYKLKAILERPENKGKYDRLRVLDIRDYIGGRRRKRKNPVKVPRRRTYEMFQGREATKAERLAVSRHAPERLDQLGDLIELKVNGKIYKFNGKRFRLAASGGKLWIAGGKFAKANPKAKTNEINPIGEIEHVVYGTRKPHHGDHAYTHYIHQLGEDTGHRPTLCVDREGYPIIRGGKYKIEARGIVN